MLYHLAGLHFLFFKKSFFHDQKIPDKIKNPCFHNRDFQGIIRFNKIYRMWGQIRSKSGSGIFSRVVLS
jgi:hypothetical protein